MIGLHFGAWLPQAHAHALGNPKHVDLWETDMPTALTAAGFRYETFSGLARKEADFLQWIIGHVRQGHPVIIGVKLLPDVHPEYEIDHLMPIVGFTPEHLVANTNLPHGQAPIPYAASAAKKGVLLTTASRKQFGWAVTGLDRSSGVSLRVVAETAQTVTLDVQSSARVVRQDDFRGTAQHVTLDGGPLHLPADVPARFSSTAL